MSNSDLAAAARSTNLKRHVYAKRATLGTRSRVYPADMTYFGGPVVREAKIYNLYVLPNGAKSFAGQPQTDNFTGRLDHGQLIHVLDQYVGATFSGRYPFAKSFFISYAAFTTLADNDVLAIVHAGAAAAKDGSYHAIFNVFLPQGVDVCFTGVADCNASFTSPAPSFCAYHASVDFADTQHHILFTVQPYQVLDFCGQPLQPGMSDSPNGLQQDSTESTLSHEISETITDPDPISGWFTDNVGVSGEIGDLCAYLPQVMTNAGKQDYLQREYSNKQHACVASLSD
ncbi:MAG: hypothetical protein JO165_13965 [Candidatus Eremiobacteraeota bacterium]|nr:hypothetical protein [Candidatus Eremiobacteraeota bacterium]